MMTQFPDISRYCFFRVHKFVSAYLADFEQKIAVADFTNGDDLAQIKQGFEGMKGFIHTHAQFEDEKIHQLLRNKGSTIHEEIENDHHQHDALFENMASLLKEVEDNPNDLTLRIQKGYEFYVEYRKFYGEMLVHFYKEETIILSELQRLNSDDELRSVEAGVYKVMKPEQILGMLKAAFPAFNYWDKEAFLLNIGLLEPEKLKAIWPEIKQMVSPEELHRLECSLKFQSTDLKNTG